METEINTGNWKGKWKGELKGKLISSKKLSEDGMHVMLVGRRTEKLEETKILCKNNVDICSLDVSNPNEVENLYKKKRAYR